MTVPVAIARALRRGSAALGSLPGAFAVLALLVTGGCDLAGTTASDDLLVVEAFFEPGRAPAPVVLRRTQPFGASAEEAVGGADVRVTLEGRTLAYHADPTRPGRYLPRPEADPVPAHAEFALDVRWEGRYVTARGRVPPPITIADVRVAAPAKPVEAVLLDSLQLGSPGTGAEEGYVYPVEVTVAWAGEAESYWIRTQLRPEAAFSSTVLDFFLQPEAVFAEAAADEVPGRRSWTGVYAVAVDGASDPLPPHRVRVALVRSDSSYARFAATRDDPARRDPLSNVDGGLGVAAGLAVDSLTLQVR